MHTAKPRLATACDGLTAFKLTQLLGMTEDSLSCQRRHLCPLAQVLCELINGLILTPEGRHRKDLTGSAPPRQATLS